MADKLQKSKLRLDKAETEVEKAKSKIPKKKAQKRLYDKEKPKSKLDFTEIKEKQPSKLIDKPKPTSKMQSKIKQVPQKMVSDTLHDEVSKNRSEERV